MSLTPGMRIGPYQVIGKVGEGGMGQVYEARDTKLNRTVALKILPPAFASDPDRLARFKREAQVLASLNHPNIAAIYGFEDSGETHALVMELVPGRTLAELTAAPMAVSDALPIAKQIASALEAAHEQGVIHRDLKPANIKITDDGTVKVLDFGLAKAMAGPDTPSSASTLTSPAMTEMGMILGTAGYMAPEQAKGKPVDRRADIWALGVVLFEMLSGQSLYRGETVTETIAHVITQPPDWTVLPGSTPASIRRLLRRCLEKDPKNRVQSAGDVRIEIDEILAAPSVEGATTTTGRPAAPQTPAWRRMLPWAVAGALLLALVFALRPRPVEPQLPVRVEVRIGTATDDLYVDPDGDGPIGVLSPDGRTLVYLSTSATVRRLYIRPLDRLESKLIPGTEGAAQQFFSPDGRDIAFFANASLMRMPVEGGSATPVTSASAARGGTWGPDNTIVFSGEMTGGLSRVPASGGSPAPLTKLGSRERTHRWPSFLPDGKSVLFMCQLIDGAYDDGTIEVVRLDTGERKVLVHGGTYPRYVQSGHLVYSRQNALYAVRFDPERLEVRGEPQQIMSGILTAGGGIGAGTGNGAAQFSIASNGTLAYVPASAMPESALRLAILDRTGKITYEYPESRLFRDPRLSPDNKRVAVRVSDGKIEHLYVLDPARETLTKATFEGAYAGVPIWSNDGQQLAFASDRGGKGLEVYVGRYDGTGVTKAVTSGGTIRVPTSFSPDGSLLAVSDVNPKTNMDVVVVSLADGKVTPFVNSVNVEMLGTFSPNGKWMAYQMLDASGVTDIYVRAYPDGSALRQVSSGGGFIPYWTKGGHELVYAASARNATSIMAVDVMEEGSALTLGKPRKLFEATLGQPPNAVMFHAAADGNSFAALLATPRAPQVSSPERTNLTFVFNFFEELWQKAGR